VASAHRPSDLEGGLAPEHFARLDAEIRLACRNGGLPAADAEDVAGEVWLCLLCHPRLLAEAGIAVRGVVKNYVKRYWRRRSRLRYREGVALDSVCERGSANEAERLESQVMFDELASRLPEPQARLLALLRSGHNLAAATRALGAPRGSRDYLGRQLIWRSRRLLGQRRSASKG
jgi:hypothetical protein